MFINNCHNQNVMKNVVLNRHILENVVLNGKVFESVQETQKVFRKLFFLNVAILLKNVEKCAFKKYCYKRNAF